MSFISSVLGHSEGGEWVAEEPESGNVGEEEEEEPMEEGDEENEGEGRNDSDISCTGEVP